MRLALPTVLLVAVLLAGCVASGTSWEVRGTFKEDASDGDLEDLRARLRPHDGEMVVMESFPMQFVIETPSEGACEEVRAVLGSAGYIDFYGECDRTQRSGGGDTPTSSPTSTSTPTHTPSPTD